MACPTLPPNALPYPFKTKPYLHQLTCWLRNKDLPVFAYLPEMGTGKSKMLIDTAAYMYDTSRINALVVVAPKSVYRNWQDSELPAHMPDHVRYKTGVWSAEGRKADLDALEALGRVDDDLHVLLMNVEALGRDLDSNRAYAYLEKFLLGHQALLAIDESTVIKNAKATRTKALMKLRRLAPVRRILSGQPAPNGPLDLYSQCEFLEPGLLGYGSFFSYKAHFANLVPMHTWVNSPNGAKKRLFHKVNGYRNLDELHKILSRFSFIVKKEDCLDLPEKLPAVRRNVEMGPKQRKAYQEMKSMAIVEIERSIDSRSGYVQQPMDFHTLQLCQQPEETPVDPGQFSTATLVITQMLRLHQILCGFIVTDDRKPVLFDEVNPRLEDLIEQLNETSGKVVVWATYKVSVRQIAERIAKEYGPESVVTYYGDTSTDDRRAAIRNFQDPDSPVRFFVSNKTGARGITLTASHTAIYYSYDPDSDIHEQSKDRIHRIGQHWPCSYVYQRVPGTVDDKFLDMLAGKLDISKVITASNWRSYLQ